MKWLINEGLAGVAVKASQAIFCGCEEREMKRG
jgi:hypothetical protein